MNRDMNTATVNFAAWQQRRTKPAKYTDTDGRRKMLPGWEELLADLEDIPAGYAIRVGAHGHDNLRNEDVVRLNVLPPAKD